MKMKRIKDKPQCRQCREILSAAAVILLSLWLSAGCSGGFNSDSSNSDRHEDTIFGSNPDTADYTEY